MGNQVAHPTFCFSAFFFMDAENCLFCLLWGAGGKRQKVKVWNSPLAVGFFRFLRFEPQGGPSVEMTASGMSGERSYFGEYLGLTTEPRWVKGRPFNLLFFIDSRRAGTVGICGISVFYWLLQDWLFLVVCWGLVL